MGKHTSEVIMKYTDMFSTGFQKTIQQIQGGTLISKKAIRELDQVSTQMIKTGAMVFTPLAMGMKSTLQEAMNIENAFAKVATIADESQKPMIEVSKEMIETSKQYGQAIGDIGNAYYQVISATVDTANAHEYVDVATKMAIGGFTDEVNAVNGLTTAMAAYKKMGYDVARVGDIMAQTQVKGKTTIGELAEVMGQVVPYTSQMGLSFEDLGASMAVLTSNGLNTAMAATTFKNALNSILKPSSTAIKMFEKFGIKYGSNALNGGTFGDYLDSIKNSIGLSQSAQEELSELAKNEDISDAELMDFYERSGVDADALVQMFKNIRGATAMLSLTGSMEKYHDFRESMNAENSTGLLEKQYETMANTLSFQLGIFRNDIKLAMGNFGQNLVPYVKDVIATVKPYLDTISQMDQDQARKIADIAVRVLGVSGGMIAIGTIGKIAANAFKTVNFIWKGVTNIVKWGSDISKIATTMGQIAGTIGGIFQTLSLIGGVFGIGAIAYDTAHKVSDPTYARQEAITEQKLTRKYGVRGEGLVSGEDYNPNNPVFFKDNPFKLLYDFLTKNPSNYSDNKGNGLVSPITIENLNIPKIDDVQGFIDELQQVALTQQP